jgi:AraC-like DNA-binding protein
MRHALAPPPALQRRIVKENDPAPGISISTLAREYPTGAHIAAHAHGSDQLIYAGTGIMQVSSKQQRWILPPHFGLWIPARVAHEIHMPEPVAMRTLYLRSGLADLGPSSVVLHISPLLRELIFEIVRIGTLHNRDRTECALRDLVIAQLRKASPMPTGILLPHDPRALAVAEAVMAEPALRSPLVSMCKSSGISVRTLERIFRKDVGMSFESWRRQVRLMKAIELLVAGHSVKQVAGFVGYQEPSAFVSLFRSTFGITPKAWAAGLRRI